jgi:hypothetical protein
VEGDGTAVGRDAAYNSQETERVSSRAPTNFINESMFAAATNGRISNGSSEVDRAYAVALRRGTDPASLRSVEPVPIKDLVVRGGSSGLQTRTVLEALCARVPVLTALGAYRRT